MSKLKALVTAEVLPERLKALEDVIDFTYDGYFLNHDVMSHSELKEKIKSYDILICEYDTVGSDILDAASNLKIIICCRGGVKNVIDLDKAMEKGIIVCNNAGRNASAVSDMTLAFILNMTRNIVTTNDLIHGRVITEDKSTKPEEYRDTVWGLDNDSPFIKYRGKSINHMVLGLVGFGHAGRLVAKKAHAFDMKIVAYDPYADESQFPDYVRHVHFDELLEISDIVSLHCVATPQTKGMFSEKVFKAMKAGSYFINTSRGDLVDEEAMTASLNSGHLAGAAIDVTCVEPISSESPLLDAKNLIITPHIAGSSYDVQCVGTEMVAESLADWLSGKKPRNCVVYI
ncbi:MAG: hypothetical protein GX051_04205 [Clostridiales bacterium]|nr:hypothetical protein [Clostridiales bacterium]